MAGFPYLAAGFVAFASCVGGESCSGAEPEPRSEARARRSIQRQVEIGGYQLQAPDLNAALAHQLEFKTVMTAATAFEDCPSRPSIAGGIDWGREGREHGRLL